MSGSGKSSKKRSSMAEGENNPQEAQRKKAKLLVRIIDTPQFQRLRNIKQLGGGYFVFPGASHNRFEHSIGVAYLAGKLAKHLKEKQPELKIDDKDILCVEIAGLCHDLGHGPFSHLYDGLFIPRVRPGLKWKHENASIQMFDHMVKVNDLEKVMKDYDLEHEDQSFIKQMITGVKPGEDQELQQTDRSVKKSFLYEIVANKINGFDVDKFDYFARDCHHLGIQNNFDHDRYIMFSRVCEVDKKMRICFRDKEVRNLYDMFYTRITLHRRAYQHRVKKVIEVMIAEAFVKADKNIEIIGSEGKKRHLSEAIDDMVAYTKLTDCVFDQILNSSSPTLAEAREILERIVSRQLYTFLGQTKARNKDGKSIEITENVISSWKEELATPGLQAEDFEVIEIPMNYGKKNENPINHVYFYSKYDNNRVYRIPEEQLSDLRPRFFSETLIMVYYKKSDESVNNAKENYQRWCQQNHFQVGDTVGL